MSLFCIFTYTPLGRHAHHIAPSQEGKNRQDTEMSGPVRLKTARKSYSSEPRAEPGKNFCVNHALRSTFGRFDTSKKGQKHYQIQVNQSKHQLIMNPVGVTDHRQGREPLQSMPPVTEPRRGGSLARQESPLRGSV